MNINTEQKGMIKRVFVVVAVLAVISVAIYLLTNTSFGSDSKDKNEVVKSESYILLNDLISNLNLGDVKIEKYSFDLDSGKENSIIGSYDGYSVITAYHIGGGAYPFNDELKNRGFVEDTDTLSDGRFVDTSVYSKDNIVCLTINEARNPESWPTENPDYSSNQTFACAEKITK